MTKNFNKEKYIEDQKTLKNDLRDQIDNFLDQKTLKDIIPNMYNPDIKHNYSYNNFLTAWCQCEKRGLYFTGILNSYANWIKQEIQVLKGMQGLKILVPTPKKFKEIDKETNTETEKVINYFKIGNTFDLSQTSEYTKYIEDQEKKDKIVYSNHTIDYNTSEEFIKRNFKYKIEYKDRKLDGSLGSYQIKDHIITIRDRNSHTLFHEFGHYITRGYMDTKIYAVGKILAEMECYCITLKFDKNIKYNFNYSNIWANRVNIIKRDDFVKYADQIKKDIDGLIWE